VTAWTELSSVPHSVDFVDVGPWRTRVLQAGTGTPLILMHGTGGHLEAFTPNIASLSKSFRVIAYDFPGHGYSTMATSDLEIDHYVSHLEKLMSVLGIETAHLCGESLGGWVAVKFAAAHPARVLDVVLNTPGGTMATPEVMERIRSLSQAAADDPSPSRIRSRLEWLMAERESVTDELVEMRRGIYAQPGFSQSMRHILCLQNPEVRKRNLLTDEDLAQVPGRGLVIWTSHDPSGPAEAGQAMATKLSAGEYRLIEKAGHWPQWEQSAEYNRIMLDFLTLSRVETA